MPEQNDHTAESLLLDESFIQYCLGDPAATAQWEAFEAANPNAGTEIEKARRLYFSLAIKVDDAEIDNSLQQLKAAIRLERSSVPLASATEKLSWRRMLLAAAVITGILITSVVLYHQFQKNSINNIPVEAYAKASYDSTVRAGEGERKTFSLPDGSEVTLNYGSSVKISSDYNQQQRWIYLEGEAFFSVKPDKKKPFVVITSKNATSALGTSFKVRDYSNESKSDVMLATGKVKVQSLKAAGSVNDVILLPGEKATCTNDAAAVKSRFDATLLSNWRALKIELDEADLDKIIDVLEFNYGVQVKLQNKPDKAVAFTGKFSNESLHDVLEAISFTNKFSYTQHGNIISVSFQ